MRLRRPCEHGRYDEHEWDSLSIVCNGGEFLADDTLVIEPVTVATVDRIARILYDWDVAALSPGDPIVPWAALVVEPNRSSWHKVTRLVFDALAVREGEG